jgi:hypothetical protein
MILQEFKRLSTFTPRKPDRIKAANLNQKKIDRLSA